MLLDPTMLCDAISAVAEFMVRVLHSRMLLDPTMLCDVIIAVTDLMVRVLRSRMILHPHVCLLLVSTCAIR